MSEQIKRIFFHKSVKIIIAFVALFNVGIIIGKSLVTKEPMSAIAMENADLLESQSDSAAKKITRLVRNLYSYKCTDYVDFELFWQVWDKVKTNHVDQTITDVELFYGALEGLVAATEDPYSVFLPPEPADEFVQALEGEEFSGIGAEIGVRTDQLTVVAPLPDSPAENAGILAGDIILAIDSKSTAGISVEEAVKQIRGEKGTVVVLTIVHKNEQLPQDISITRGDIKVPTILWEMLDGNLAHIRVSHFNQNTWREFDGVTREVLRSRPSGIILDLRNNPGGYLDTAVAVASEWVPDGAIVKERLYDGSERVHKTTGSHRFKNIPTIVLINQGSASGSEIVAGALQDYKKATLVGETSFGKGSVQDFEVFSDKSALKLTIAKWYTPNDRAIDQTGIEPDILIEDPFITKHEQETGEEPPVRVPDPKNEGHFLEDEYNRDVVDVALEKAKEQLAR